MLRAAGREWIQHQNVLALLPDFATLLYRRRLADEKEDALPVPGMLDMPNGPFRSRSGTTPALRN